MDESQTYPTYVYMRVRATNRGEGNRRASRNGRVSGLPRETRMNVTILATRPRGHCFGVFEGVLAEEGMRWGGTCTQEVVRPKKVRAMLAMRACRSSIMIGRALDRPQVRLHPPQRGAGAQRRNKVANRDVGVSGGRPLTRPFRDARRFPSTRWYFLPGATRTTRQLGFVHRSRAIFCRPVPNASLEKAAPCTEGRTFQKTTCRTLGSWYNTWNSFVSWPHNTSQLLGLRHRHYTAP
jgi:hypothetical protein